MTLLDGYVLHCATNTLHIYPIQGWWTKTN